MLTSWTSMATMLMEVVERGDVELVKILLKAGCDVSCSVDDYGNKALHIAANAGNVELINLLLDSGCDVSARNIHGDTALLIAVKAGHLQAFQRLLEAGSEFDPHEERNIWGLTPLMYAVRNDHIDIVNFLLARIDCVNHANRGGQTALLEACNGGFMDCTDALLRAGASPEMADVHGQSPLMVAVRKWHQGCVKVLLQHGANPCKESVTLHSRRWVSMTPMYAALYSGRIDMVRMLWATRPCSEADLFRFSLVPDLRQRVEEQNPDVWAWLVTNCQTPHSLGSLCHRAVSQLVGYTSGRNCRLQSLDVPAELKKKLLLLDL
ncbi:ankyrin repeat domain-containing protein 17-like isoform X1 [Haliotis rubra]|uniref:ankyrin repeat domain-containing protein 17-like isoform X1 n=1 Tax=Haliotis rubra TaxID=36100 RepID=UPI001EE60C8C|nr:ankyrin repeat domain-containing protein 17-like isoform X1 [Haliotis rubra]XP_046562206.1 ankyrin repeat domain-containing protein 17-like isoform X1 [Haliotis rubra]